MIQSVVARIAVLTTSTATWARWSRRGRQIPRTTTMIAAVAGRNQRMAAGTLAVDWVSRSSRSWERRWSAATSIPKVRSSRSSRKVRRKSVDHTSGADEPFPSDIAGHSRTRTARA
ncbi:hypothetical protein ABZ714_01750 [Streptomyces sp. NPDC006798]|uniref:hypothetical protein n=1 Tax=Streptomyces sp. NPDC006798 TaxID=3155462 RepID=UPI0033D15A96